MVGLIRCLSNSELAGGLPKIIFHENARLGFYFVLFGDVCSLASNTEKSLMLTNVESLNHIVR